MSVPMRVPFARRRTQAEFAQNGTHTATALFSDAGHITPLAKCFFVSLPLQPTSPICFPSKCSHPCHSLSSEQPLSLSQVFIYTHPNDYLLNQIHCQPPLLQHEQTSGFAGLSGGFLGNTTINCSSAKSNYFLPLILRRGKWKKKRYKNRGLKQDTHRED